MTRRLARSDESGGLRAIQKDGLRVSEDCEAVCCGDAPDLWVVGECCHPGNEDSPCSGIDPEIARIPMARLSWIVANGFPVTAEGFCTDEPGAGDFWDGTLQVTVRDGDDCVTFYAYASSPGGPYSAGPQPTCLNNPGGTPCEPDGIAFFDVETSDPTKISCRCCDCGSSEGANETQPCDGDWVDPNHPDWVGPGGPVRPTNPDGDARCCTGDTICSPNDDEAIAIGFRVTGTIKTQYRYLPSSGGGNALRTSERNFDEFHEGSSGGSACEHTISMSNRNIPMDHVFADGSTGTKNTRIRALNIAWNRDRGFFGGNTGDNSGINVTIENMASHRSAGHDAIWDMCRTNSPLLPISPRLDSRRIGFPATNYVESPAGQTVPSGQCLNRVVAQWIGTYLDGGIAPGENGTQIDVTIRVYAYAAFIAPCPEPSEMALESMAFFSSGGGGCGSCNDDGGKGLEL